jgi:hypothetical protein
MLFWFLKSYRKIWLLFGKELLSRSFRLRDEHGNCVPDDVLRAALEEPEE